MYPHRAMQPETRASVVLAYKVIKVTSDFSPDKETTKGMERIENSSKKDLFCLGRMMQCGAEHSPHCMEARAIPVATGFLAPKLCLVNMQPASVGRGDPPLMKSLYNTPTG